MTPSINQASASNGHTNGKSHQHEASNLGFSTRAIHVGSEPSEDTGALIPAISLSTTFKQHGVGGFKVNQTARVKKPFLTDILLASFRTTSTHAQPTPIEIHSKEPWRPWKVASMD